MSGRWPRRGLRGGVEGRGEGREGRGWGVKDRGSTRRRERAGGRAGRERA